MLEYLADFFTGGNHTYNRTAVILKQLLTPAEDVTANKDTESREQCDCFKDILSQSTRGSTVCKHKNDNTLSLTTLLKQVTHLEELNETFSF